MFYVVVNAQVFAPSIRCSRFKRVSVACARSSLVLVIDRKVGPPARARDAFVPSFIHSSITRERRASIARTKHTMALPNAKIFLLIQAAFCAREPGVVGVCVWL